MEQTNSTTTIFRSIIGGNWFWRVFCTYILTDLTFTKPQKKTLQKMSSPSTMESDAAQDRLYAELDTVVTGITMSIIRRLQGEMHKCSATCCDNNSLDPMQLQNCLQDCAGPLNGGFPPFFSISQLISFWSTNDSSSWIRQISGFSIQFNLFLWSHYHFKNTIFLSTRKIFKVATWRATMMLRKHSLLTVSQPRRSWKLWEKILILASQSVP